MSYREIILNEIEKLSSKLRTITNDKERRRVLFYIKLLELDLKNYEQEHRWPRFRLEDLLREIFGDEFFFI